MKNTGQIVISQSINNGTLSAIFAPDSRFTPRPAAGWWLASDYDSLMKYLAEQKLPGKCVAKEGNYVFSLACDDDLGFGVFTLGGFGTAQEITWDSGSDIVTEWWDAGYEITACGARNSRFYYVMTKGAKGYNGKAQACGTMNSWGEAEQFIEAMWGEGKIITGICYSTGLNQYLVIMTESSEGQIYELLESAGKDWLDEWYAKEHHPTIVFKDPSQQNILVVMTGDANRSGYTNRYNYPLKI